ncbi:MAG: FprA family A-type flavoprotein [Planctomycetota bacterium]
MDTAIAITEGSYWVGVNDRETDLFESIWPLPRGVSYNSYVITGDHPVIIDTVKRTAFDTYLPKIQDLLEGRAPEYLVINHLEPDHSGSIRLLRQVFPDLTLIGNKKTAEFLGHLYAITEGVQAVEDGEELDLGDRTLRFVLTPMVHWPETMMTYDVDHQTLYSGDAFGGFGALDGGVFDDEVDVAYFDDEILRYFSNIVGKYCKLVQRALGKLEGTDVSVVAPTHGPVWRHNPAHIIGLYDRWSRHEAEEGVVLAYASMYGNSTKMMEAVARGLSDEGLCCVRVHDVSRTHVSFIIRDAWRYKGLILGSPTYDTMLFPPMQHLVDLLEEKRLRNRLLGIFGTYGWSGGAVETLTKFAESARYDVVEPVVEARFSPKADDVGQCHALGRAMARAVRGDASA